jgi:hypothetical protein
MAIKKNQKPLSKAAKGFKVIKSDGTLMFDEIFKTKLAATENLVWAIEGSMAIQEKRNKELKKPKSVYSNAVKYFDCKIVTI